MDPFYPNCFANVDYPVLDDFGQRINTGQVELKRAIIAPNESISYPDLV